MTLIDVGLSFGGLMVLGVDVMDGFLSSAPLRKVIKNK